MGGFFVSEYLGPISVRRGMSKENIEVICRYTLAAITVISSVIGWRCEPHSACHEQVDAATDAAGTSHAWALYHKGKANECQRWTP